MWIDAIRWAGRLCYLLHRMDLIRAFSAILVLADPRRDFEDVVIVLQDIQKAKHVFHFRYHSVFEVSVLVLNISVATPESNWEILSVIATLGLGYANSWCLQKLIPTCPLEVASWHHWCWQLPMAMKKPLDFSWNLEFLFGEAFCFVSTYSSKVSHNRSKHIEDNMIWY